MSPASFTRPTGAVVRGFSAEAPAGSARPRRDSPGSSRGAALVSLAAAAVATGARPGSRGPPRNNHPPAIPSAATSPMERAARLPSFGVCGGGVLAPFVADSVLESLLVLIWIFILVLMLVLACASASVSVEMLMVSPWPDRARSWLPKVVPDPRGRGGARRPSRERLE